MGGRRYDEEFKIAAVRQVTIEGHSVPEVARLMKAAGIRSQTGYRRPRFRSGRPSIVVPNRLNQKFDMAKPDTAWVTDITYIRTHEGWLYLAVVIDLFSRKVIGWAMD